MNSLQKPQVEAESGAAVSSIPLVRPVRETVARMLCRAWVQGATNFKWEDPELDRRVELDWHSWLNLADEALA